MNRQKVTIGIYSAGIENLVRLAEQCEVIELHYSYEYNRLTATFPSVELANRYFDRYIQQYGFREETREVFDCETKKILNWYKVCFRIETIKHWGNRGREIMKYSRCTWQDLEKALEIVNLKYEGNIEFNQESNPAKNNFRLHCKTLEGKGHRLHYSYNQKTKRSRNACWHVHGDFFDALFSVDPSAVFWLKVNWRGWLPSQSITNRSRNPSR